MQYIVHIRLLGSEERKFTEIVDAASEQDAIEYALDVRVPGLFVVDYVEPVTPAQEKQ